MVLEPSDGQWLKQKQPLRLGISAPDYGPFDLAVNGQDFEGVTADYAQLLSELLHVGIEVGLGEVLHALHFIDLQADKHVFVFQHQYAALFAQG